MSTSYWLDQSQLSSVSQRNYEFLVVGGGVAGLSAAYWLQREKPGARIAVLEKNQLGSGASGRNAGFVTCGSTEHFIKLQDQFGLEKALEIWKFSEKNRSLVLEHIIEDQGSAVDFKNTGSCTVAPNAESWEKYKKVASTMRKNDIDIYEVGPNDLEKDYGIHGFEGGIHYAGDGYVHPIKLLQRLRNKLNIALHENTEVFALEDQKTHQIVKTDKGIFRAEKVLITLNAYLPLVLRNFSDVVTPGRGQVLLTEPLPNFVRGPCYLTKHLCYFRQLPTGHLLVGGFRNLATDVEKTYSDETTPLIQEALLNFVKNHFKYGANAKAAYQWSGIMGFTPDGQMLIGELPDNTNVHIMAGCSGHGMGLSFHAAKTLVDGIFGRDIPSHLQIRRYRDRLV